MSEVTLISRSYVYLIRIYTEVAFALSIWSIFLHLFFSFGIDGATTAKNLFSGVAKNGP